MSTETKPKPPTPPPDGVSLLKLEQAGYLMQVSARSVRRLIDEGKLAAVRVTIGGQLRVERSEVDRFIRAGRFTERPDAEPDARSSADQARTRETNRSRVKAEWNTGEDPFDEKPSRKGKR